MNAVPRVLPMPRNTETVSLKYNIVAAVSPLENFLAELGGNALHLHQDFIIIVRDTTLKESV